MAALIIIAVVIFIIVMTVYYTKKNKELIAEGTPITEVCYACGFKNYSTFSRAYKKSFGESPRDFLQSLKN